MAQTKAAPPPRAPSTNGHVEQPRPISISELKGRSRPITVDWFDDEITARYYPNKYDADYAERVQGISTDVNENGEEVEARDAEQAIRYSLEVLHSIPSLCEDDGSAFQMTTESLRRVPTALLWRLLNAVLEDMRPKEQSESPSDAG